MVKKIRLYKQLDEYFKKYENADEVKCGCGCGCYLSNNHGLVKRIQIDIKNLITQIK